MLVQSKQNTHKEGDILVFKMPTGEEIIAKLKEENMVSYVVTKPATLMVGDAGNGQIGVDMQPSLFCMDINNTVEIMKSGVLMVTKVRKELQDAYIKSTSGIQVAGAGVLDGIQGS